MSAAIAAEQFRIVHETEPVGVSLPLDALEEPGTYICNWSGHLLRVHETDRGTRRFAAAAGRHPGAWTVTRISVDPRISRQEAKSLANSFGLSTSF